MALLPDLTSLRCFEAAARHDSFRAAAAEVALSPAAFSDRIARLEDDLGVRLFERSTRSLALSPAGLRLLPHARALLGDAGRIADVVRTGALPPFDLTLGTRYELGLSWLLPALATLERDRPERHLHLRFGDSPELLSLLREGHVDAVVTSFRLTAPGLRYVTLHEERYAFVGTPAALAAAPLCCAADAAHHTLIDAAADLPLFRYFLDADPGRAAWSFARTRLLGTIAAVRDMVLAGHGVAVLPRYFVEPDLRAGRLAAICPEVEPIRDFFRLVWREGHALSEELRIVGGALAEMPLR